MYAAPNDSVVSRFAISQLSQWLIHALLRQQEGTGFSSTVGASSMNGTDRTKIEDPEVSDLSQELSYDIDGYLYRLHLHSHEDRSPGGRYVSTC